jgi:hypothetical protein
METNTYLLHTQRNDLLKQLQKQLCPLYVYEVYNIYFDVKRNNKIKKHLLKEFQHTISEISKWSDDDILSQYMKFKSNFEALDDLVKVIFQLDITIRKNVSSSIPQTHIFLYQCMLTIARCLWKNPMLVYDIGIDNVTCQKNKLKIEKTITSCIKDTFTHFIPIEISTLLQSNISLKETENKHYQEDTNTFNETNNNVHQYETDSIKQTTHEDNENIDVLQELIDYNHVEEVKDKQDTSKYYGINDDNVDDITEYEDDTNDIDEDDTNTIDEDDEYNEDNEDNTNDIDEDDVDDTNDINEDNDHESKGDEDNDDNSKYDEDEKENNIRVVDLDEKLYLPYEENVVNKEYNNVKNVVLGKKTSSIITNNNLNVPKSIKVVDIDDKVTKQNILLALKKKVKSSVREDYKHGRFGGASFF